MAMRPYECFGFDEILFRETNVVCPYWDSSAVTDSGSS
jgi:hypothetical protein